MNLHRKTSTSSPETAEGKAREREVFNRERTWLLCYCLDRSLSAQMGKPHTIKEECVIISISSFNPLTFRTPHSAIIRDALLWVQSPLAQRGDFFLVAYVVSVADHLSF